MNLTVLLIICIFVGLYLLSYVFTPLEKYRKYLLILLPAIGILLLFLFKGKAAGLDVGVAVKTKLDEVKADIKQADTIAAVKADYIKQDKTEELKKLADIEAIKDREERMKQLADLVG